MDLSQVILNARIFKLREEEIMEGPILQAVLDLFDTLESHRVDYVLVGGLALLQYIDGRNTEDIDLILSVTDLKKLPGLTVLEQDQNFGRANFEAVQVDLLLTRNKLFNYVRRRCATTLSFRGRQIPCSTVEGLLLLKFYALPSLYRQGNFDKTALYETDILMLLQKYSIDVSKIFTELEKHLDKGDIESLQSIYQEIEARIKRFKDRF